MQVKSVRKIVVFVLVAAIAITTGLLTGKAILDSRGGNLQLGALDQEGKLVLPPAGKTAADFDAVQNFLYAKAVMMSAGSVEVHSSGTAAGTANVFGTSITQHQVTSGVRFYDGETVFLSNSTKNIDGIMPVDVEMQVLYRPAAEDGLVALYKRDGKEIERSELAINGDGSFQYRFGYDPRNFMPLIVKTANVKQASQTVAENGDYVLTIELLPAAAENYKRHVWEMSGSSKIPEYTALSLTVTITPDFIVKEVKTHEEYKLSQKVGIEVDATSVADTTDVYTLNGSVTIPENKVTE